MGLNQQNFEQIAAESYLAWWCDAGVDVAIGNMPHDWLGSATIKTEIKTAKSSPVARPMPQTLEVFVDDLMTGDIADAGPASRRVRPAGNPASDLMILTDFPDAEDIISGELLGDPLFTKMLTAMGRSRASVYIASLCPGRPMTGQLSEPSIVALAEPAKQHLALIGPKQLWLVGSAASRAILGVDDAAARGKLHSVNYQGLIIKAIATAHPRMFRDHQSRKAAAWVEMQRLLPKETV